MIRSMTAFARASARGPHGELSWELRSVNHRYLELGLRLPDELRQLEPQVRERVAARVQRGKVDCTLRLQPGVGDAETLTVNLRLADQLLDAAEQLRVRLPTSPEVTVMELLRWPGVLASAEQDLGPVRAAAATLLEQALDELVATREGEGERLAALLHQRCAAIAEQVDLARRRLPAVLDGVRDRLRQRLAEVSAELDPTRVEQELAMLAQRLDVDEELDRIDSHLSEVRAVLGRDGAIGRRLDFLMQELNREANTLGAKSADAQTTAISVELKVLIEQMREQVQNIE